MNVLITGALGLIGSEIARQMTAQGNVVIGVDDLSHPCIRPDEASVVSCVTKGVFVAIPELKSLSKLYHFDLIIHCASPEQWRKPETKPVSNAHDSSLFTGHITSAIALPSCFHLDSSLASCLLPAGVRRWYLNSRRAPLGISHLETTQTLRSMRCNAG